MFIHESLNRDVIFHFFVIQRRELLFFNKLNCFGGYIDSWKQNYAVLRLPLQNFVSLFSSTILIFLLLFLLHNFAFVLLHLQIFSSSPSPSFTIFLPPPQFSFLLLLLLLLLTPPPQHFICLLILHHFNSLLLLYISIISPPQPPPLPPPPTPLPLCRFSFLWNVCLTF